MLDAEQCYEFLVISSWQQGQTNDSSDLWPDSQMTQSSKALWTICCGGTSKQVLCLQISITSGIHCSIQYTFEWKSALSSPWLNVLKESYTLKYFHLWKFSTDISDWKYTFSSLVQEVECKNSNHSSYKQQYNTKALEKQPDCFLIAGQSGLVVQMAYTFY